MQAVTDYEGGLGPELEAMLRRIDERQDQEARRGVVDVDRGREQPGADPINCQDELREQDAERDERIREEDHFLYALPSRVPISHEKSSGEA